MAVLKAMDAFILFSKPWWVNLFILAPFIAYFLWKKELEISAKILFFTAVFAIAFGFVEASVVVYLRRALDEVITSNSAAEIFRQSRMLEKMTGKLILIEILREIATIAMLFSVSMLSIKKTSERWAIFLWTFAFWDIFYYISLRFTVGWPEKFTTSDVLFLIPVPWLSQVWYPLLISSLFILAVSLRIKYANPKKSSTI